MENIEKYKGKEIAERLDGLAKECYLYSWDWMEKAWTNTVEFERMSEQILYCKETEDYLYAVSPEPVKYVKGTRPQLEKVVDEVCKGLKTDREKVIAIFVYLRDLHKKFGGASLFLGGTEEELIKKGEWYCERISRLMVGLCEILGFPGRIIYHIASGHLTCEIYFEDRWAYFDPRFGMFYLDENDNFLSVAEIIKDRDVIYRQTDYVHSFISDYQSVDFAHHRNYYFCFNPNEIQCFGPYSLMDADKYHFDWILGHDLSPSSESGKIRRRYDETGMMLLVNSK
ncbi:MAG: transglutaminase domain-containing protein [Clostridia bacterium]|nr:transglutaminase domain-containing protein [Clostridia bacterium]